MTTLRNITQILIFVAVFCAATLLIPSQASATLFTLDIPDVQTSGHAHNDDVGTYKRVKTTLDTNSNIFTLHSTFEAKNGKLPEFLFLVISDGDNPKRSDIEYPIFYMDIERNLINVFAYDADLPSTGKHSYENSTNFITKFQDAMTISKSASSLSIDFALNVLGIQNFSPDPTTGVINWKGVSMGERTGLWYHTFLFDNNDFATYNSNDVLTDLDWDDKGYLDFSNKRITVEPSPTPNPDPDPDPNAVPEPATLTLMGMGAGFGLIRRKFKSKK